MIDDNPIEDEESESGDSGGSGDERGSEKRKKHDEDDLDDNLEDDDYDLLEENLGHKIKRTVSIQSLEIDLICLINYNYKRRKTLWRIYMFGEVERDSSRNRTTSTPTYRKQKITHPNTLEGVGGKVKMSSK